MTMPVYHSRKISLPLSSERVSGIAENVVLLGTTDSPHVRLGP